MQPEVIEDSGHVVCQQGDQGTGGERRAQQRLLSLVSHAGLGAHIVRRWILLHRERVRGLLLHRRKR
jgi:hypothetical protein